VPVIAALLLLSVFATAGTASAQTQNWVNVVAVTDMTGNQALQPTDQLIAGHTYNDTIMITVPFSQSVSKFTVALAPAMLANGSQFWYLHTPQYAGYNRTTFTSSLKSVTFDQAQGQVELSAIFKIPLNLTTVTTNGIVLHFEKLSYPLIVVTVTGGAIVGTDGITVVDQAIQAYLTLYQSRSTLVSSGQVDSSYAPLLQQTLNLSQSLYKAGLTTQATSLLESISPSNLPTPPSSSYVSYIIIAVIFLAIIAAALALLWVRGRGKAGFATGVVNEANSELASLEVVAGRYDKNLADQLKALREKLTEAS
jgi:hypothetical protein